MPNRRGLHPLLGKYSFKPDFYNSKNFLPWIKKNPKYEKKIGWTALVRHTIAFFLYFSYFTEEQVGGFNFKYWLHKLIPRLLLLSSEKKISASNLHWLLVVYKWKIMNKTNHQNQRRQLYKSVILGENQKEFWVNSNREKVLQGQKIDGDWKTCFYNIPNNCRIRQEITQFFKWKKRSRSPNLENNYAQPHIVEANSI